MFDALLHGWTPFLQHSVGFITQGNVSIWCGSRTFQSFHPRRNVGLLRHCCGSDDDEMSLCTRERNIQTLRIREGTQRCTTQCDDDDIFLLALKRIHRTHLHVGWEKGFKILVIVDVGHLASDVVRGVRKLV